MLVDPGEAGGHGIVKTLYMVAGDVSEPIPYHFLGKPDIMIDIGGLVFI